MKLVIQRVTSASVEVEGAVVGAIDAGLLVFVGIGVDDTSASLEYCAEKLLNLRIFGDEGFDQSMVDTGGDILIVSQFTLYGDCKKGRRPSFIKAMPPAEARKLYDRFVEVVREKLQAAGSGGKIATGEFQAMMQVSLVNDGPVTIILED